MIEDCRDCGRSLCYSADDCAQYRANMRGRVELDDQDFEERDTPVIDEGCIARAKQIDWSAHDDKPPMVVVCRMKHPPFRAHAQHDAVATTIISRKPCPMCGSHDMRSMEAVAEPITVAGELGE